MAGVNVDAREVLLSFLAALLLVAVPFRAAFSEGEPHEPKEPRPDLGGMYTCPDEKNSCQDRLTYLEEVERLIDELLRQSSPKDLNSKEARQKALDWAKIFTEDCRKNPEQPGILQAAWFVQKV